MMARRALIALALVLCTGAPVGAQQPGDTPAPDTARVGPSPGGAFVRSLLVPGWGQASFGHYFRGGVYFAAQTGSWYMLLRTIARLNDAEELAERREDFRLAELERLAQTDTALARQLEDPVQREQLILQDTLVADLRGLVDAREQQREDWIAWTIFWTLASAADAFVTAHLADFPGEFIAEPRRDGAVELRLTVPFR